MPNQLIPMLFLASATFLIVGIRRARLALAGRRDRRQAAEAREYARIIGWMKKIRPDGAGPAIQRDEHGNVELFRGLRRYARTGRRTRRSRRD